MPSADPRRLYGLPEEEEEEETIPEARHSTSSTLSSVVKQTAARNREVEGFRFSMPGIQWTGPEHTQQQPTKRRRIGSRFDDDYDVLASASDWSPPVCVQEETAHGAPDVSERESAATATLRGEDIELCVAHIERALAVDDDEEAAVATLASPNLNPFALHSAGCLLSHQDIERAFAVDDGEEGAVASTKSKVVKRTSIFGRRHNNQENKKPSPHIPRVTMWMTCWGTCKREFGWTVPSQQYYHAHNKKPPQFCDACATQRHNNKRNLSWNTDK